MFYRSLAVALLLWLTCAVSFAEPTGSKAGKEKADSVYKLVGGVLSAGQAKLSIEGQIQVQSALYAGEDNWLANGDPAEQEGFRLRRSRIKFRGGIGKHVKFGLGVELFDKEETPSNLYEAYVEYLPAKFVGIRAGAFELPWTKSTLISSQMQSCIDRPLGVKAMAPRKQMGAVLRTELFDGILSVQVGAFNSLHRKMFFHEGYEKVGLKIGNRYGRLVYVARFDVAPLGSMTPGVPDIDKTRDLKLNIGAGYFYNDGNAYKIHAFAADLHVKAYGFALLAGYLIDSTSPQHKPNEVSTITDSFKRSAWFVTLDYTILAGLLGVHARYEYSDDNDKVEDEGDEAVIVGGVNIYGIGQGTKLQLDYMHRVERHGRNLDNDTVLAQVQVVF